jgi:hypothetical protein
MSSAANETPIGKKLGEFVHQQLQQAQELLARRGEKRHKGVYKARKCMRRARAALAMLLAKDAKAVSRLDKSLAKLCRSLSTLRDAQALNEVLSRLGRTKPAPELGSPRLDDTMLSRALLSAEVIRAQALEEALLLDPELADRRAKLQSLVAESAALPWLELTAQDVIAALQQSEARARKASGRAAKDNKDHVLWHSFRKRVRRVRHQRAILDETLPQLFVGNLPSKKRADVRAKELGESQDDALLLRFCKRPSHFENDVRMRLREAAKARLRKTRLAHTERAVE